MNDDDIKRPKMNDDDIKKLTVYVRKLFSSAEVEIKKRPGLSDSVEVYLKGEYIGLIFIDDDPSDRSFSFQIPILEYDILEGEGEGEGDV